MGEGMLLKSAIGGGMRWSIVPAIFAVWSMVPTIKFDAWIPGPSENLVNGPGPTSNWTLVPGAFFWPQTRSFNQ